MATGVWTERDAVTGKLARKALDYIAASERTIVRAKQPGFTDGDWNELADMIDTAKFRRMSKDRDPITWENYPPILTNWARKNEMWCKFKRVTEADNMAFLELEEHHVCNGIETTEHTMSVFEFDGDAKIVTFEVYFMVH